MYCEKCNKSLPENATTCPFCGGKDFSDELNLSRCALIYGPPFNRKYTCSACKKVYHCVMLGCPTVLYCPFCGEPYPEEDPIPVKMDLFEKLKK